ncbi:MAG TPA: LCP family protein [Candidatus Limnocylindrales bacterium]
MTGTPTERQRPRPAATIAAILSFVWPGIGQWYGGRLRVALVFAIPILVAAIALVIWIGGGLQSAAIEMIDPAVASGVLILIVLLAAWRIIALLEAAYAIDRRRAFRGRAGVALGVLVALVLASHGLVASYAWAFYEAGSQIFVPEPTAQVPQSSESPGPTELYVATPFATPASDTARITILLTGIDKNAERTHSLTDTLLVLSLDPETDTAAMISLPRDVSEFPLYNGGLYRGKINSLMSYADRHPKDFPDGPLPTLAHELGYLLGIPIHYYAAVDLGGFEQLIDAAGGVDIDVKRAILDGRYDWLDGSDTGFFLSVGPHHLNGRIALAFVRSRQGVGDNDFVRADRQQQLLLALRKRLLDPAMVTKLPELLDAAAKTIRTNFPPDRINEMLALAEQFDTARIRRYVLRPPTYSVHPPTNTTNGTYILRLRIDAIARLSVKLFGADSAYWTGAFDPAGSPIPGPLPSPVPN